jgi:metal-sulfur cluster biosynthetic enzyme
LRSIVDPCSAAIGTDLDIVEMGLVEEVTVDGGAVTVSMRLTSPGCLMVEYFAREVDDVVGSMSGVASVTLETDAGFEWHRGMMEDAAKETRETRRRELADRYADALGVASTAAGVGTTPPDEEAAGGGGERERTK